MVQNSKFPSKVELSKGGRNINCEKGLTMVEILVVIAIIAILATVVFVSVGNQRQRSRLAGATTSVKSAMTIAGACYAMGETINAPPVDSRIGSSVQVCGGAQSVGNSSVWPDLPEKCYYCGMSGTQVLFQCTGGSCSGVGEKSSCDYDSTECIPKN